MSIVEILKVIVLGIVEGFTEWMPISSTGHMILVDEIIRLNQPDAFKDMFLVVIQLGAILAVAVISQIKPIQPSKVFQTETGYMGIVDQDRDCMCPGSCIRTSFR